MVATVLNAVLTTGAAGSAFCGGWLLWRSAASWRRRVRHRAALAEGDAAQSQSVAPLAAGRQPAAVDDAVIAYALEVSQRMRSPLHALCCLRGCAAKGLWRSGRIRPV